MARSTEHGARSTEHGARRRLQVAGGDVQAAWAAFVLLVDFVKQQE
ncbi:hypothetical protein [Acetobacter persici]